MKQGSEGRLLQKRRAAFAEDAQIPETEIDSLVPRFVTQMNQREQRILLARLGVYGAPPTLEELGTQLGIGKARVGELESKGLRQLARIISGGMKADPKRFSAREFFTTVRADSCGVSHAELNALANALMNAYHFLETGDTPPTMEAIVTHVTEQDLLLGGNIEDKRLQYIRKMLATAGFELKKC